MVPCLIHAYDQLCNWIETRVGSWMQRVGRGEGGGGGAKHLGERMIGKH